MFVIGLLLLLAQTATTLDYAQMSLFHDFPEYCCRLEMLEHDLGTPLPSDTILRGVIDGKQFGWGVDAEHGFGLIVSEDFKDRPLKIHGGTADDCKPSMYKQILLLQNPNECSVGWYSTRYKGEDFYDNNGMLWRDDAWFFPSYSAIMFGTRKRADGNIEPGIWSRGNDRDYGHLYTCPFGEGKEYGHTDEKGTDILYVDCRKSIVTMSERRLRNFTVPDNSIDSLSQSDNIMLKRTVINRTNATQKQTVSFSVEKSDSVEVLISSSYMSSECNDQKKSFSNNFGTKLSTEMTVETSFWVASAKAKVGADITSGFESAEETAKHACDETTKGNGETKSTKKTTTLSFVDEIAIPPMTSTVITGKSTPYKGTLPYTISYELYPRGNRTLDTIMKGLEHFKMADKVTKLSDGAIIVEFEGRIKIDTGYDVFVDIAPTPL